MLRTQTPKIKKQAVVFFVGPNLKSTQEQWRALGLSDVSYFYVPLLANLANSLLAHEGDHLVVVVDSADLAEAEKIAEGQASATDHYEV